MTSAPGFPPAALPHSLRRSAGWAAGLAAAVVLAIGIRYAGRTRSSGTDRLLEHLIVDRVPERIRTFMLVVSLGDPLPAVLLAGLLGALCLLAGRRRLAVLALLGPGLTGVATTLLKPLFDRTVGGEPAYPSGHTGALTALALVAALLLVSLLRAGALASALLITVGAVGAGAVMAVALTVLDVHYPTDTIGGFGTAVAVVLGVAVALDRVADTRLSR